MSAPTAAAPTDDEEPRRYSVSVDCDGVLHSYTSGWQGADSLPDPPVEGAIDWLNEVGVPYDLVILTTRARHAGGIEAVEAYLRGHGCVVPFVVTAEKLPALVYVDDRAYRFKGRFPDLRQIRYALKPWRADDPPPKHDPAKAQRRRDYHLRLEAANGRLRKERARLYEQLIGEVLLSAGVEGDVAHEWMRQHERDPLESRLDAARVLRSETR